MLSIINKNSRDINISQNKYHQYIIDGKKYISVSKFIAELFEPFDENKIIESILCSKKMEDPNNKYYNKSKEDIKILWNEIKILGINLHKNIENFLNKNIETNINTSIEFQYFLNFLNDFDLIPFRTEWQIYDDNLKIAGCLDAIFIKDNKYYIYDWKRCNNLSFTSFNNNSIKESINYIPNTNYWHYALQLNIYKYILEKNYSIKIESLNLVLLHPENLNYQIYEIENFSDDEMIKILF